MTNSSFATESFTLIFLITSTLEASICFIFILFDHLMRAISYKFYLFNTSLIFKFGICQFDEKNSNIHLYVLTFSQVVDSSS